MWRSKSLDETAEETVPLSLLSTEDSCSINKKEKEKELPKNKRWELMGKENSKTELMVVVIRALSAEFVGSFFVAMLGVGTAVTEKPEGDNEMLHRLLAGMAMAAAVTTMNYTLTVQSGSIFNPAITATLILLKQLPILRGILYIAAQLAGWSFGALTLRLVISPEQKDYFDHAATTLKSINPAQGLIIEAVTTAMLAMATLFISVSPAAPDDYHTIKPFVTAAAVFVCAVFGGPLTGGGHNPARSFGYAVATNVWDNHWVYWVGPMFGVAFALGFYIIHHTSDFFKTRM
eukprot:TRINITY_DN8254_c0_g1_i1.p1 TRINITY_DN8254_c0_g1~~TRINITY_DN8254_c0_g1_i1.p1  ORF type:complete len:290 (-),score=37.04 TRINITY_DN8254_c0_g1_i1:72-941(-)